MTGHFQISIQTKMPVMFSNLPLVTKDEKIDLVTFHK